MNLSNEYTDMDIVEEAKKVSLPVKFNAKKDRHEQVAKSSGLLMKTNNRQYKITENDGMYYVYDKDTGRFLFCDSDLSNVELVLMQENKEYIEDWFNENKKKYMGERLNMFTLESFINFCDDMMIAEEGIISNYFQKRKDEKARRKAEIAKKKAERLELNKKLEVTSSGINVTKL